MNDLKVRERGQSIAFPEAGYIPLSVVRGAALFSFTLLKTAIVIKT